LLAQAIRQNRPQQKIGDEKIDQKQKWISFSSSSFRPFSFLFRLGSQRRASQDSAKSGDKSSHSKLGPFPAAKRPTLGASGRNFVKRK
jgi:hypothetical protein